jgi:hypothetical protein
LRSLFIAFTIIAMSVGILVNHPAVFFESLLVLYPLFVVLMATYHIQAARNLNRRSVTSVENSDE